MIYRLVRGLFRLLLPLRVQLSVEGTEHVPRTGAFLLVLNHQSYLDPVLAQVACPRTVHAMTKSSAFGRAPVRWLLLALRAFPTRRYRVDPQAVRTALRLLEEGKGVALYPEGERSWDGRFQPLRRGAVRLMLKAGVPVVPCGVIGSYDLWPRWSRTVARGPARVRFGEPLTLGRHDDRAARESALSQAMVTVETALREAAGKPGRETPSP